MSKYPLEEKKKPSFINLEESSGGSLSNDIEVFFTKPKDTIGDALKIGIAVFIAMLLAYIFHEMYEEYQARKFAHELLRQASTFQREMASLSANTQARIDYQNALNQAKLRDLEQQRKARELESKRQIYLDNYWEDVGSGIFINLGRTKRYGDLATAIIKVNNREQKVDINCKDSSYWSEVNHGWFFVLDPNSSEYKFVKTACLR